MRKTKLVRTMCLILAVVLCFGLTACGSSDAPTAEETTGDSGEVVTITYAFATFTSVPADVTEVENVINAITVPEIGVKVKLLPLSVANYSQQIALMISSNQDLDLIHSLSDMSQYAAKNQIIPLDDLIQEYGQDILEIEPDFFLEAGKLNGKLYGVPFYMGKALSPVIICRKDILDELNIDPASITSFADLDGLYAQVQAAHPEMTMLAPLNQGDCGILYQMNKVDFLTDNFLSPTGVLMDDSTTVVNYYATEEFKAAVEMAREFAQKGYISADAATTTNLAATQLSVGAAFSTIGGYAGLMPESQFAPPAEGSLISIRLDEPTIATGGVNTLSRLIPVSSKHPEAAMKFLNLMYSNIDLALALTMGVEGRDYLRLEDGTLVYPEGKNMLTVDYNCTLSCVSSNQFVPGLEKIATNNAEDMALQQEENKTAWRSQAFGFTFDTSPVKNQYSAVNNVINQYLPGLRTGALDPETELPKFLAALEDAGINDIIAEKQAQLDAWLAAN